MYRRRLGTLTAAVILSAGCNSTTAPSTTPITPTTPPTSSATILVLSVPATLSLGVGDSTQLKPVATLRDGTTQIFTDAATWHSSNTAVATVTDSGIVSGVSAGQATVTVGAQGATGTVAVTVTLASADPQTFLGTLAAPGPVAGSLALTITSSSRTTGTLYFGQNSVGVLGRFDALSNIVNVSGGGYAFAGTLAGGVLTGALTGPGNSNGGFTALDSSHNAVTTFCGSYSGSGSTPLGNPEAGAWSLSVSIDGKAAAESVPGDGSGPPLIFTGRTDGVSLTLNGTAGRSATGAIQTGTATGTFQASFGSGTFNASSTGCH